MEWRNTNTGGEHVDSMAVVVNRARYLVATTVRERYQWWQVSARVARTRPFCCTDGEAVRQCLVVSLYAASQR
jgi:hypothetical protein